MDLVKDNFWVLMVSWALYEASSFLVNRVSHRLTNEVFLLVSGASRELVSNMWWLVPNFEQAGLYQVVVALSLVVVMPFHVLLMLLLNASSLMLVADAQGAPALALSPASASSASASASTSAGASSDSNGNGAGSRPAAAGEAAAPGCSGNGDRSAAELPQPGRLRAALAPLGAVLGAVRRLCGRWEVLSPTYAAYVRFLAESALYEALCLTVLALPWALPRLVSVQLSLCAILFEGAPGGQAVSRSKSLTKGRRWSFGFSFTSLVVASQLLPQVRDRVLAAMPVRWMSEVPEVYLATFLAFFVMIVVLKRMRCLLPLVVYRQTLARDGKVDASPNDEADAFPVDSATAQS